jgi:hypothetical protein
MKAEIKFAAKCIVVGAAIAAASLFLRSAPKAQPTLSLPFATVTSVGASAVQILPANPSRRSVTLCNPSASLIMYAAPLGTTPTSGGSGVPIPVSSCFSPPPLTASGTTGGAGAGWNAIMSGAGPTNVLALEW